MTNEQKLTAILIAVGARDEAATRSAIADYQSTASEQEMRFLRRNARGALREILRSIR